MKVLYCSDLHGWKPLYDELAEKVQSTQPHTLVLGGDLTPHATPAEQKEFLAGYFLPLLERMRRSSPSLTRVFVMMGNDDWKSNMSVLESHENDFLKLLHLRVHELSDGLRIAGYSCVPVSPFKRKDWERVDRKAHGNELWRGTVSSDDGVRELDLASEQNSYLMEQGMLRAILKSLNLLIPFPAILQIEVFTN